MHTGDLQDVCACVCIFCHYRCIYTNLQLIAFESVGLYLPVLSLRLYFREPYSKMHVQMLLTYLMMFSILHTPCPYYIQYLKMIILTDDC